MYQVVWPTEVKVRTMWFGLRADLKGNLKGKSEGEIQQDKSKGTCKRNCLKEKSKVKKYMTICKDNLKEVPQVTE